MGNRHSTSPGSQAGQLLFRHLPHLVRARCRTGLSCRGNVGGLPCYSCTFSLSRQEFALSPTGVTGSPLALTTGFPGLSESLERSDGAFLDTSGDDIILLLADQNLVCRCQHVRNPAVSGGRRPCTLQAGVLAVQIHKAFTYNDLCRAGSRLRPRQRRATTRVIPVGTLLDR